MVESNFRPESAEKFQAEVPLDPHKAEQRLKGMGLAEKTVLAIIAAMAAAGCTPRQEKEPAASALDALQKVPQIEVNYKPVEFPDGETTDEAFGAAASIPVTRYGEPLQGRTVAYGEFFPHAGKTETVGGGFTRTIDANANVSDMLQHAHKQNVLIEFVVDNAGFGSFRIIHPDKDPSSGEVDSSMARGDVEELADSVGYNDNPDESLKNIAVLTQRQHLMRKAGLKGQYPEVGYGNFLVREAKLKGDQLHFKGLRSTKATKTFGGRR